MPTPRSLSERKSKTQTDHRLEYRRLTKDMQDHVLKAWAQDSLPDGWDYLDTFDPITPTRKKITLRLDADMLAWFQKLGPGYQARINQVLRIYWKGVLSGDVIRYAGEDTLALMLSNLERHTPTPP